MKKFVIAGALAAAAASPAFAQDAASFTGPKIEAIAGWDRVESGGGHDSGAAYGIGIGYDFRFGGVVAGIEGEAADSSTSQCVSNVIVVGDRACLKAQRDLYVGGRVGTLIGANALIYAKAGYTNARANLQYKSVPASPITSGSLGHESLDGVRVGAGLEYAFGEHFYAKTEYRYSNYESDFERHQVVAGVGFRF